MAESRSNTSGGTVSQNIRKPDNDSDSDEGPTSGDNQFGVGFGGDKDDSFMLGSDDEPLCHASNQDEMTLRDSDDSDSSAIASSTNNNDKMDAAVDTRCDDVGSNDGGDSVSKSASAAILQDLDVLDLTESLTKSLVRGKDGSLRDSESLQELDQDDLAAILPDVSTGSSCNESHSLLSELDSQHPEADHYNNVDEMICDNLVSDTLAAMAAVDVGERVVPVSPSGGTSPGSDESRLSGNVENILAGAGVTVECKSKVLASDVERHEHSASSKHVVETNVGGQDRHSRHWKGESVKTGKADKKSASSRLVSPHRSARAYNAADETSDVSNSEASKNQKAVSTTVKSNRRRSKSDIGEVGSSTVDHRTLNTNHANSRNRTHLSMLKFSRKSPLFTADDTAELQQGEPVDCLLRIDTASNVSPDSGIQSISGSPNMPDSPHLSLSTSPKNMPCQTSEPDVSVLDESKHSTATNSTDEDMLSRVRLKKAKPPHVSLEETDTLEHAESTYPHETVAKQGRNVPIETLVTCLNCPTLDANIASKMNANDVAVMKRTTEVRRSKTSAKDRNLERGQKQQSDSLLSKNGLNNVNAQCGDSLTVDVPCSGSISVSDTIDNAAVSVIANDVPDVQDRLSPCLPKEAIVSPVVSPHVDTFDDNSMSSDDTPLAFIRSSTARTEHKTEHKEQDTIAEELRPVKKKRKPGRPWKRRKPESESAVVGASLSTEAGTLTLKHGLCSSSVDKVGGVISNHPLSEIHVARAGRPRKHPRLDAETVLQQLRLVAQQKSLMSNPVVGRPWKHRKHIPSCAGNNLDASSEDNRRGSTGVGAVVGGTQTVNWCNSVRGLKSQMDVTAVIDKPKRGRPFGSTKKKSRNVLHKPVRRRDGDVLSRGTSKSKLGLVLGANGVSNCRLTSEGGAQPGVGSKGSDNVDVARTEEERACSKVGNLFDKFLPSTQSSSQLKDNAMDNSERLVEPLNDALRPCSSTRVDSSGIGTGVKRKRGRPRKIPLTAEQIAEKHERIAQRLVTVNTNSQQLRHTTKKPVSDMSAVGGGFGKKRSDDGELDSLVQSVQDSIDSQFRAGDEELENGTARQMVSSQKASLSSKHPQAIGSFSHQGKVDCTSQWRDIQDEAAPKFRMDKAQRASLKLFHRRRRRKRQKLKSASDVTTELPNHDDNSSDDLSLPSLPKLTNMTASPRKESLPQSRAHSWCGPCLSVEVDGASGSMVRSPGYISGELALDDDGSDPAALGSMPTLSPNSTASMPDIPPRPPLLRLEDFMRQRRRRKLKHFKSKHRNIFDPMFLAEVDDLIQELHRLRINESGTPLPPFVAPEKVNLPAAFNLSWQLVKRRLHRDMHLRRVKHPGLGRREHRLSRESGRKGFRRKVVVSEDAGECMDLATPEQCLPLKKRHMIAVTQLTSIVASSRHGGGGRHLSLSSSLSERRKVGRPRKHPLPVATVSPQKITQPAAECVEEAVVATTQKFSTVKENADVVPDNHSSSPAPKKDSIDEAIEAALKKSNSPNCDKIVSRQDSIDEAIEATVLKYSSQDGATGGAGRKHRRRTKSESIVGSSPDQLCVPSPSKEDAIGKRKRRKGNDAQGEMSSPAGDGPSPWKSPGRKSNDGGKAMAQPPLDSLVPLSSSSDDEDTGIGNEEDFSDDEDEPLLARLEKHAPASHNPGKTASFLKKSSSPSTSNKADAETETSVKDMPPINRADFETQVDLPSNITVVAPVKKMTTFDVGTQVEPEDTLEFTNEHSTSNVVMSEIAIQATGPDDGDEVVRPSVDSATDSISQPPKDVVTSQKDSPVKEGPSVDDSAVNPAPSVVEMSEPDDCDQRTSAVSQDITVELHSTVIRHTKVGQTSPVTKQSGDNPVEDHMTEDMKMDSDDIEQGESTSQLPAGRRTRRMRMVQRAKNVSSSTRGAANKKSEDITSKHPLRQVRKSKSKTSTSDSTEIGTGDTGKQKELMEKSPGLLMKVTRSDEVVVDVRSVAEREKTASGCADCAALQSPVRGHGRRGRRRPNQTHKTGRGGAKVDTSVKTGIGGAKVDTNVKTGIGGAKVDTSVKTGIGGAKVDTSVKTGIGGAKVDTSVKTGIGGAKVDTNVKTGIGGAKVDTSVKTGIGGAKVDSNCIVMLDRLENIPSGGANHSKGAREKTKQITRKECVSEVASTESLSTEDVVVLSVQPPENVTVDTETSQPLSPINDVPSIDNDTNSITKDDDSAADVIIIDDASDQADDSNSEYEPLPVQQQQQQKRRKSRIWPGHDMGYSKPRRKRRRKKQAMPAEGGDATMTIADEDPNETGADNDRRHKRTPMMSLSRSRLSRRRFGSGVHAAKKSYQRAGLFSDTYKGLTAEESSSDHKVDNNSSQGRLQPYIASEHEFGLMPLPIHIGKYMWQKRSHFKLPYDLWWTHKHRKMRSHKVKDTSPTYKKLRTNLYVDARPTSKHSEPHPCNCKSPEDRSQPACGDDCLNRMVYTECRSSACSVQCSNQRMQRHDWVTALQKFPTEGRGYGVKTKELVPAGKFILEYLGEVISEAEFRRRMTNEYSQERHHYCLNLGSGLVIDSYRMGSVCRFVNHSCQPNCEMQKWNVNGLCRIGLFALGDIQPDTELTYDYNFHSYNLESQQVCRCGSDNCRGVVGGRAQRYNGLAKSDTSNQPGQHGKDKRKGRGKSLKKLAVASRQGTTPIKPLSHRERCFAQCHAIFLLRNITKVRRARQTRSGGRGHQNMQAGKESFFSKTDVFMTQLMALRTPRSVKTRTLALAEENSELTRTARLAQVLKEIFSSLVTCKDEDGNLLCTQLMSLPSKKRFPDYYELIVKPIDLNTIEKRIDRGDYKTLPEFHTDITLLFYNVERYCGRRSDMGKVIQEVRAVYEDAKTKATELLEAILGLDAPEVTTPSVAVVEGDKQDSGGDGGKHETVLPPGGEADEEEEIIRCVCNIFRDEGLMIQCEKCETWQHCECMGVSGDVENYLCEHCDPRPISREVLMVPQPDDTMPGHKYYMTMLRGGGDVQISGGDVQIRDSDVQISGGDVQIRVGDCAYLMQESPEHWQPDGTPVRIPYDKVEQPLDPAKMDIFRVEQLWRNENDEKFAFGHRYFRPEETYHEPNRRFFPNEVFRMPLYEIIPLEQIIGTCCVMDLNTHCKGRPKGVRGEDVYVCEYRLDKTAHLFYKISRTRYPINCKSYCFDFFPKKLQPKRTYLPHAVPDAYRRRCNSTNYTDKTRPAAPSTGDSRNSDTKTSTRTKEGVARKAKRNMEEGKSEGKEERKGDASGSESEDLPLSKVKELKICHKKERLETIMTQLLSTSPGKTHDDIAYLLLEGSSRRSRQRKTSGEKTSG